MENKKAVSVIFYISKTGLEEKKPDRGQDIICKIRDITAIAIIRNMTAVGIVRDETTIGANGTG